MCQMNRVCDFALCKHYSTNWKAKPTLTEVKMNGFIFTLLDITYYTIILYNIRTIYNILVHKHLLLVVSGGAVKTLHGLLMVTQVMNSYAQLRSNMQSAMSPCQVTERLYYYYYTLLCLLVLNLDVQASCLGQVDEKSDNWGENLR